MPPRMGSSLLARDEIRVSCQDEIRDAFRRAGDVRVQIIRERDTGESRGFGFVTFQDAARAAEALATESLQKATSGGCQCMFSRPTCREQSHLRR